MVLTTFPGLLPSQRPSGLTSLARRILHSLGHSETTELSLVLTTDAVIHDLNLAWRHMDKPTDVLSFSLREGEGAHLTHGALGDVVISVETSRRQADERRWSLDDELAFLLIHGILHLSGYDHMTEADARVMEVETQRVWSQLGRHLPLPAGFLS